jgi:NADP-dependent 3-hydroxy acid dehydrogenase YdfG
MLARRKDRLARLHAELGDRASSIRCDVTDLGGLEASVAQSVDALGGLDGVVNAAGRGMVGTISSGDPAMWRELLDLNLVGPLATVRYAVPYLIATAGRRDVIFVGATGAITPSSCVGVYAASKRGLRAAFDTLRLELAGEDINEIVLRPTAQLSP